MDRAYTLAEQWATDPERMACLLKQNMTDEHWQRITASISRQIAAIGDDLLSHEQCLRSLLIEANELNGVITELVFLPIAVRMVEQMAEAA